MQLPEYLLESLHVKKTAMATEVKSFKTDMKAYLVIYPIEENKVEKYKTNLLPIVSYEILYIRHKDIYTEERWGFDYDYVLDDTTTRIKRAFIERAENNSGLIKYLSYFEIDLEHFKRLMSYNFDSALLGSPINNYLNDVNRFPHLWIEDYIIK